MTQILERFLQGSPDSGNSGEQSEERFDLVSSNHTLEHLYTPDETIAALYRLLRENGALISTLPIDATPGSPFLERVTGIVQAREVHRVDLVYLDAGHPWKTNPEDLQATFLRAGFARVDSSSEPSTYPGPSPRPSMSSIIASNWD